MPLVFFLCVSLWLQTLFLWHFTLEIQMFHIISIIQFSFIKENEIKTNLIGMGVNPCSIFKKDFGYFNMSS